MRLMKQPLKYNISKYKRPNSSILTKYALLIAKKYISMIYGIFCVFVLFSHYSHGQVISSDNANDKAYIKSKSNLHISEDNIIPMMSHSFTIFVRAQREDISTKKYRYKFYTIDIKSQKEDFFIVESEIKYSSGFCNDQFIILTSNNTNSTPAILLHCIGESVFMESCACFSFSEYNITTYTKMKHTCHGGSEEQKCWHFNEWLFDNNTIVLRLGDRFPNECSIIWSYCKRNNSFAIEDVGESKKSLPNNTKVINMQRN